MSMVRLTAGLTISLYAALGAVVAQESDAPIAAEDDDTLRTESGECFTLSSVMNITVLNDRSIYVQGRARHFLLTPRGECSDLLRAYNRNTVRLVPFGRRICPNDGSHLVYETGGRERVCPIGTVSEVDDRQQARELAAEVAGSGDAPLVVTEDIDSDDQ